MQKFIVLLLRHRWLSMATIVLSLAASVYAARTIQVRFQYRDFYKYPGNPSLPAFERNNQLFGDPAGYVVATVEAPDVFQTPALEYVARLSAALAPLDVFKRVRSLATVNAIRGNGDDVVTGLLMPKIPETTAELAELKRSVLSSPVFVRRLVSPDGTLTAVLADMRASPLFSSVEEQQKALAAYAQVLAANPPPAGLRVRLTGAPAVEVETTNAILQDQLLLVPLVCTALALMLYLTFRSLQGVLLCMASVSVATIWTAGIFALFGRPVDMIGSVIPTTLLVYGVVDPIFVLARYLTKTDGGMDKHGAIVSTLKDLALPCFLTSATTGIGFAAFMTCVAPSVRYYGLTVGIGVMLSFVTTCTVLPLLLAMTGVPKKRFSSSGLTRHLDTLFYRLGKWIEAHTLQMVCLSVAILVGAGYFAREQHIDNQYIGSLPRAQAYEDARLLEDKLAGVLRMNVMLEGQEGVMKRPEVLRAIEAVDRLLEKEPAVTYSGSLADLVSEANMAFMGGDTAERHVPDSKALLGQYLAMIDPRDRAEYVTDSFGEANIAILLKDKGSEDSARLIARINEVVRQANFAAFGIKATVTGQAVVGFQELDKAVIELLWGFVTAFLIVVALEWLLFRSLRLALLTVIPNLVPVAACFLVTRCAGIGLRIDTILVLCISIGGLFNTTIHFVARTLQQLAEGAQDREEILLASLRTIGPPSLFTAAILSGGFALFVMSSFPGLKLLGLLSMVTLLTGFVSDVIFTPSLMRLGTNWRKYLGGRVSEQPRGPVAANIEPA